MPNIITHGLFAKDVYDSIANHEIKEIIKEFPREFIIGSNGPDFFFYYKFFQSKHKDFRKIGSTVHSYHSHAFFKKAHEIIENETDETLKKAMTSYLCGHLCHWALDSQAHPYIFYKTGRYDGISQSMHHRFESMLDAMMLMEFKQETIQTFKFYLLAKQGPFSLKAISSIYIPIIKEIYHQEITEQQIKDALDDWMKIQKYLYDPKGIKTKILKQYEKQVKKPYLYSGNVVPYKIDETFDVMNKKHELWCYPTDASKISNASFLEIFNQAKEKLLPILNQFDHLENMLIRIDNTSYDTGESEPKEMKHFNLIYGDML